MFLSELLIFTIFSNIQQISIVGSILFWTILPLISINIFFLKLIYLYSNFLGLFFIKINILNSLVFSLKFMSLITLFIFIRGGIPRYRYDFLTKIGWIKFLSLILSVFILTLILTLIF